VLRENRNHLCDEKRNSRELLGKLSEMLTGESAIINIKKVSSPNLSGYDAVIVGTCIRIGKVEKEIS